MWECSSAQIQDLASLAYGGRSDLSIWKLPGNGGPRIGHARALIEPLVEEGGIDYLHASLNKLLGGEPQATILTVCLTVILAAC
jgi:hypothetical protein